MQAHKAKITGPDPLGPGFNFKLICATSVTPTSYALCGKWDREEELKREIVVPLQQSDCLLLTCKLEV